MRVAIQASGIEMTDDLRSYAERRLTTALGWAGRHLRRVAVSLRDINGPRGGIDKSCKVQVQLDNGQEVIIDELKADLYEAIDCAAERADRAVVRQVGRTRQFAHERMTAPPQAADDTGDGAIDDAGDDAGKLPRNRA